MVARRNHQYRSGQDRLARHARMVEESALDDAFQSVMALLRPIDRVTILTREQILEMILAQYKDDQAKKQQREQEEKEKKEKKDKDGEDPGEGPSTSGTNNSMASTNG